MIDRYRDEFPLELMLRVLEVSKTGFFEWRKRKISPRLRRRIALKEKIQGIFEASHKVYGYRKITRQLARLGEKISEGTVRIIMKELGLMPRVVKKFRSTTNSKHNLKRSPDLVNRNFSPEQPGEILAGDITEIPTQEGKLYLATVKDLCTKEICGWAMSENMKAQLPIAALEMAISRNFFIGEWTIFHSDQGVQYASMEFRAALKAAKIRQSMGTRGDCYDNASAESFFGFLKREFLDHMLFATIREARAAVFKYIEIFYNRIRLHASIGYVPPAEFVKSFEMAKAA